MDLKHQILTIAWFILFACIAITVVNGLNIIDIADDLKVSKIKVPLSSVCFSFGFISLILVIPSIRFINDESKNVNLIYSSRFYASWSRRMWEVALPLVLIDIFGTSLIPTAIYTIIVYLTLIIVQPYIGLWADRNDRAIVQYTMVTAENVAICFTCLVLIFLSGRYIGKSTQLDTDITISCSFSLLILLGIIGEVSVSCSAKMLENDWIAVLAETEDESLTEMNAQMNRISLFAKGVAPTAFTLIYSSFGNEPKQRVFFSMLTLLVWNVLSYPLEVLYTRRVYNNNSSLAIKERIIQDIAHDFSFFIKLRNKSVYEYRSKKLISYNLQLPDNLEETFIWNDKTYTLDSLHSYLETIEFIEQVNLSTTTTETTELTQPLLNESLKVEDLIEAEILSSYSYINPTGWLSTLSLFTKHYVFLLCFSLEMIWFSVLNNGNLMMSYLHVANIPTALIGLSRSLGSLIGFFGTYLYEIVFNEYPLEKRAVIAIWLMFFPLLPIVVAFALSDNEKVTSYPLIFCTALSRMGLWCFTLSGKEIFQRTVHEKVRGAFSSMHTTLYNMFYILMFVVSLFNSHKEDFHVLVFLSIGSIGCAAIFASIWYIFVAKK